MLLRYPVTVLSLLALCPAATGNAPPKKKKDKEELKVLMQHHSFTAPLEYKSLLDDWTVSGASLFERERLLLHPGVAGLAGFVFHKNPLRTANFEVVLHFRVAGDKTPSTVLPDQAFGLWYVEENISQSYNELAIIKAPSWAKGMQEQGLTLVGSKANFKGVGIVLSMADKKKNSVPTVSGFTNDGHTTLSWDHDVPTADAKHVDFRNTLNAAQLKVRVQADSVEAWLKQSPSLSWNECFKLDRSKHPIQAGGYLGITAWSGTPAEGLTADLVSIVQLDVSNMDETSVGEDMKEVSHQIQEAYMDMLRDENRHFLDQKSQYDHLTRLADMMNDHINSTAPLEQKLVQDMQGFEERLTRLGEDCKTYAQATHLLMGSATEHTTGMSHSAGVHEMQKEIMGLRRVLTKDSASHLQKIDAVQKNLAEVKDAKGKAGTPAALSVIAIQTESLERTVKHRGSQMSWMMVCIMVAIVAIGVLMWNRMRYYERKHFL